MEAFNFERAYALNIYVKKVVPTTTYIIGKIASQKGKCDHSTFLNSSKPTGRFRKIAMRNNQRNSVMILYFSTNFFTKIK